MANYEFSAEVEAEVQIDIDITVQDEQGNEIDGDPEGYGTDISVNIDLSEVKENLKESLKEELQEEFRQELAEEIGGAMNPMKVLAEFILLVDNVDRLSKERTVNRLKDLGANIRALDIVVVEKDKEIATLKQEIITGALDRIETEFNAKEDEVNAQVGIVQNEVADNTLTITPNTEEK